MKYSEGAPMQLEVEQVLSKESRAFFDVESFRGVKLVTFSEDSVPKVNSSIELACWGVSSKSSCSGLTGTTR